MNRIWKLVQKKTMVWCGAGLSLMAILSFAPEQIWSLLVTVVATIVSVTLARGIE